MSLVHVNLYWSLMHNDAQFTQGTHKTEPCIKQTYWLMIHGGAIMGPSTSFLLIFIFKYTSHKLVVWACQVVGLKGCSIPWKHVFWMSGSMHLCFQTEMLNGTIVCTNDHYITCFFLFRSLLLFCFFFDFGSVDQCCRH